MRWKGQRTNPLFLSTLSLRRATQLRTWHLPFHADFYPRSPCGERPTHSRNNPVGGHISIHALLAESDVWSWNAFYSTPISIHALLAESDANFVGADRDKQWISIHALQESYLLPYPLFLSTLSLRRATAGPEGPAKLPKHFYPRSPCGERRAAPPAPQGKSSISIHALLAESDPLTDCVKESYTGITIHALLAESDQSSSYNAYLAENISIHALLAESDRCKLSGNNREIKFLSTLSLRRATQKYEYQPTKYCYFYPRSPCGERLQEMQHDAADREFLSTLSLRRATPAHGGIGSTDNISIHALLAESDGWKASK